LRLWVPDQVRGGNSVILNIDGSAAFAVFAGFVPPPEAYRALHGRRYKSPEKKLVGRPVCLLPGPVQDLRAARRRKVRFSAIPAPARPDPVAPAGAGVPDIL